MAKKASKHRAQRPKDRAGLIRVPRVDKNGITVGRWIRQVPSSKDLKGLPPSRVAIDPAAVRNPFSGPSARETTAFDRVRSQIADVLLDLARTINPGLAADAQIHAEDLDRVAEQARDHAELAHADGLFDQVEPEGDEPEEERDYIYYFEKFGRDFALAKFGRADVAYLAFADDEEVRQDLIERARSYDAEPAIWRDKWGDIRLFKPDETTRRVDSGPDLHRTGPPQRGEPGYKRPTPPPPGQPATRGLK